MKVVRFMKNLTIRLTLLVLLIPIASPANPGCGEASAWARNTALLGGILGLGLATINGIVAYRIDELARDNPEQAPSLMVSRDLGIASVVMDGLGGAAGIAFFGASKLHQIRDKEFRRPMVVGMAVAAVFPFAATFLSGFNAANLSLDVFKSLGIIMTTFSAVNFVLFAISRTTAVFIKRGFVEF